MDKDGQRSLVTRTADGKMKTQKLSDSFKSNPAAFAFQDVNQDGLADLVVLIPYEKVKVLLQKSGGDFDEVDVDPPGGALEQPWLASADVDGDGKPELLLPQKNFVRAVVLERGDKIAGFDQPARLGFPREGPDQRRGQRFAHRGRGGGSEREKRHALHFPVRCRAQAADLVRTRRDGRLAGRAQHRTAGHGFQPRAIRSRSAARTSRASLSSARTRSRGWRWRAMSGISPRSTVTKRPSRTAF